MKAELKLQEVRKEYRKKDQIGIPMSVREAYWKKIDELRQELKHKVHRKKLGQFLLENKLISDQQLKEALTDQAKNRQDKLIGEVLVEKGLLTNDQLTKAVNKQLKERGI